MLRKSCNVRDVFWDSWTEHERAARRAYLNELIRWCADGKLSAHLHAAYPLADVAQALKEIVGRKAMGKMVLKP